MSVKVYKEVRFSGPFTEVLEELQTVPLIHPFILSLLKSLIQVQGKHVGAVGAHSFDFGRLEVEQGSSYSPEVRRLHLRLNTNDTLKGHVEVMNMAMHGAYIAQLLQAAEEVDSVTLDIGRSLPLVISVNFKK